MRRIVGGVVLAGLLLTGCVGRVTPEAGPSSAGPTAGESAQQFPDVVEVTVDRAADGSFTFDVTMSSPYDSPERYADGWRILGPDDEVYGEMTLTHDHAAEQPFTRTQAGVEIPEDVTSVVVEGRDLANGYGGGTQTVQLPAG